MSHFTKLLAALFAFFFMMASATSQAQDMRANNAPIQEAMVVPVLPEGWITRDGAGLTFHGAPRDDLLMKRLLEHGEKSLPALANRLELPMGGEIHVYVAATQEEFRQLQPGLPPNWADGTAWPTRGIIFLRAPRARGPGQRPLEQVLDHELIHVILGQAFDPRPVPTWLQEGVAQVYAGEVGPDHEERLAKGLAAPGTPTLWELTGRFPNNAWRADFYYALSADFILWLQRTQGDHVIAAIAQDIAKGLPAETAIHRQTGQTVGELDAEWSKRFENGLWRWLQPELLDSVLWTSGGLMLLLIGFSRRKQFRARMRDWKEEERSLDTIARQLLVRKHAPTIDAINTDGNSAPGA